MNVGELTRLVHDLDGHERGPLAARRGPGSERRQDVRDEVDVVVTDPGVRDEARPLRGDRPAFDTERASSSTIWRAWG